MPTLALWTKCNNNCLMCTNPDYFRNEDPNLNYGFSKIIRQLNNYKNQKIDDDHFILTGGEPTLQPRFLDILRLIRKKFPAWRIDICTNGRRFAYASFTEECLKIKNLNLIIPFLGYNPKSHDAVTRVQGSFFQTVKGLKNILSGKDETQEIEIRIILIKSVVRSLAKILRFIKTIFPTIGRITLIFPEFEGQAAKNAKLVRVDYFEVRQAIKKNLPLIKSFADPRFYHFPLCALDFNLWPHIWRTLPAEEVAFLPFCDHCLYKIYCLGAHRDYISRMRKGELSPIKRKVQILESNNFHHPIVGIF